jgi:hypothetical protein
MDLHHSERLPDLFECFRNERHGGKFNDQTADTANSKKINLLIPQQSGPDKLSEAGLISLPRIANWWPDEAIDNPKTAITPLKYYDLKRKKRNLKDGRPAVKSC